MKCNVAGYILVRVPFIRLKKRLSLSMM